MIVLNLSNNWMVKRGDMAVTTGWFISRFLGELTCNYNMISLESLVALCGICEGIVLHITLPKKLKRSETLSPWVGECVLTLLVGLKLIIKLKGLGLVGNMKHKLTPKGVLRLARTKEQVR